MGNKEELIKYYINKIKLHHANHYRRYKYSNSTIIEYERLLSIIIDKGLDYLLTDSFIDCLISTGRLYSGLRAIGEEGKSMTTELTYYFDYLFDSRKLRQVECKFTYYDLLDDDMKQAINIIYDKLFQYEKNFERGLYNFRALKEMILATFAYYVINFRKDNIYELCDIFLDDPEKILDYLCMNNIYDKYSSDRREDEIRLLGVVHSKINNRVTREIR